MYLRYSLYYSRFLRLAYSFSTFATSSWASARFISSSNPYFFSNPVNLRFNSSLAALLLIYMRLRIRGQ